MAVDVIRSVVRGRDSSPGRRLSMAVGWTRAGWTRRWPPAAPSSRGRRRSARARIRFTHLVELVPYSCASARRGGVDSGGVRRRPGRTARNANEAVRKSCDTDPRAPVRHIEADARSGRLARPVAAPAWCANPAAGGGPRPVRRRRRARPAPGAGRTGTAWRGGAIIATASRVAIVRSNGAWTATTTAGLAQGRWMIATGDNDT